MSKTLRLDDTGADVKRLQKRLAAIGFNPGAIDGEFGTATEQAVLAFQLGRGLLADGVAGPRTQQALGLVTEDTLPDATGAMTVQVASRMCPGALLVNIKTYLPVLLQSLTDRGLHDRTIEHPGFTRAHPDDAIRRHAVGQQPHDPVGRGLAGTDDHVVARRRGQPRELVDRHDRDALGNTERRWCRRGARVFRR